MAKLVAPKIRPIKITKYPNLEHKLTVDDLIVEYMMYKVKHGYEPKFSTSEFIGFLYFFAASRNPKRIPSAIYLIM